MSNVLTTVTQFDWTALYAVLTTIYGIISTVIAKIQTNRKNTAEEKSEADLKNMNNLMNPTVKTDNAQRQLIIDGKVDDANWKMTTATRDELYQRLTDAGASVSASGLNRTIDQAEQDKNVEYVIRCFDYKQDGSLDNDPAAFISYGQILSIGEWSKIKEIAKEHEEGDFYSISK